MKMAYAKAPISAVDLRFAVPAYDAGNLVRHFRWRPLAAETSSVRPSVKTKS
jgi:hypothetical protein